ncbi:hypothetical protein [Syntrophaceticus schinkii]|jgi:hypothetical protein|uniref:Uncharacterized protein n=1 Tax=Syntrophaceticus schinkii TaxID=499207 RepID=A0A0B7MCB4_9FIRM|nr:hypothetical protein [Syntrophaceticus schinkii]MDD2503300.1 hypothetical protein [Clostridia bacterium]CEO88179.1 hypothetical protein SSCH_1530006 [Syntrophaceticus schinkii]
MILLSRLKMWNLTKLEDYGFSKYLSLGKIFEENLNIIRKNETEQGLLNDLLNRVQSVNEDDSKAINLLWKELWIDILKEAPPSQYKQ